MLKKKTGQQSGFSIAESDMAQRECLSNIYLAWLPDITDILFHSANIIRLILAHISHNMDYGCVFRLNESIFFDSDSISGCTSIFSQTWFIATFPFQFVSLKFW